jgi:hypothetical protein
MKLRRDDKRTSSCTPVQGKGSAEKRDSQDRMPDSSFLVITNDRQRPEKIWTADYVIADNRNIASLTPISPGKLMDEYGLSGLPIVRY